MSNDLCDNCEKYVAIYRNKKPYSHGIMRQRCEKCLLNETLRPNDFEPIKNDLMPNKLTPLDVFMIMSVFVHGEPLNIPDCNPLTNVENESIRNIIALGLMDAHYKLTEGGRMLVEALCSTPLPVQKWVMPNE